MFNPNNNSNPNEVVLFGQTNYRNIRRKFGIKTDDRRRHVYLIGKTGVGKSTVLENMIYQDIQAGRGVAVVDPHGDLAERAIDFVPGPRINETIYFNPADIEYPIALMFWKELKSVTVIWLPLVWWVFLKKFGLIPGDHVLNMFYVMRFWPYLNILVALCLVLCAF